jgi:hypothetical protein
MSHPGQRAIRSLARAYGVEMQDPDAIRRQKRRSSRAVVAGLAAIAIALLVSTMDLLPPVVPTIAAIAGFALIMYGVHVGWLVFYNREPDGPAS